jgi:cytochrome oxidase assembly protein ShyY1
MNLESYLTIAVIVLSVAIFALLGIFLWQIHRLIDKVMCRNYAEYVQLKKPQNLRPEVKIDPEAVSEEDVLKELNGLIGP